MDQSVITEAIQPLLLRGIKEPRIACPSCSDGRRKKGQKTLSITFNDDHVLYMCHHCDEAGRINLNNGTPVAQPKTKIKAKIWTTPNMDQIAWLDSRGITDYDSSPVLFGSRWFGPDIGEIPVIGFEYDNPNGSRAVKWRASTGEYDSTPFGQDGSANSLWGISGFDSGNLIITEGEMDTLAAKQAGLFAVSIPSGAPDKAIKNATGKYSYLWDAREEIAKADNVILAMDADGPGEIMSDYIAHRIGKHKCLRVSYPKGCKDLNDVLVKHDAKTLIECIDNASPFPITGIHSVDEFKDQLATLWEHGPDEGIKTGISGVDDLYTFCPSMFTLVTGVPGHGKSSFLNWLSVNIAKQSGKKFGVWSAETDPKILVSLWCSIYQEKTFRGPDGLSPDELEEALAWVNNHFVILGTDETNIDEILDTAASAILRDGIDGVIIDPYNFLTISGHGFGGEESTHERINDMLRRIKNFCIQREVHTILVAHPRKMQREGRKIQVPDGYDVSGSASFFNIPDVGLTIYRGGDHGNATIHNWKTRFDHMGKVGKRELQMNTKTKVYGDVPLMTFRNGSYMPDFEVDDDPFRC